MCTTNLDAAEAQAFPWINIAILAGVAPPGCAPSGGESVFRLDSNSNRQLDRGLVHLTLVFAGIAHPRALSFLLDRIYTQSLDFVSSPQSSLTWREPKTRGTDLWASNASVLHNHEPFGL